MGKKVLTYENQTLDDVIETVEQAHDRKEKNLTSILMLSLLFLQLSCMGFMILMTKLTEM